MRTSLTLQASETMAKEATLQEAVDGLFQHRAPGPVLGFIEIGVTLLELVPIVLETLLKWGPLRMTGPVGICPGHSLLETKASSNLRGHLLPPWPSGGVELLVHRVRALPSGDPQPPQNGF